MSVLVVETSAPVAAATWSQVGPTLWVASTPHEFVGTVERVGERFVACDGFAIDIGIFNDLATAKAQVLQHPADPAPPRTPSSALAWAATAIAGVVLLGSVIWMSGLAS